MSEGRSTSVTVILVILGILFLVPGACGTFFLTAIVSELPDPGGSIGSDTVAYGLLIMAVASGSVVLTLFLLGILMRAGGWAWARQGSLVIAILSTGFVLINHLLMERLTAQQEGYEPGLILTSVAALAITALPAFLHWRSKT